MALVTTIPLFAGASGDHQPVHIDIDVARARGRDDVFAHGMLSVAHLGRLLTNWVPQERIRSYWVRFVAITPVHGKPTCTGRVTAAGLTCREEHRCVPILAGLEVASSPESSGAAVVKVNRRTASWRRS